MGVHTLTHKFITHSQLGIKEEGIIMSSSGPTSNVRRAIYAPRDSRSSRPGNLIKLTSLAVKYGERSDDILEDDMLKVIPQGKLNLPEKNSLFGLVHELRHCFKRT